MPLTTHTLALTPAQEKAALRVNAAMALAPRLKTNGWRLAVGQRLNGHAAQVAGAVTGAVLRRRGVTVSSLTIEGPAGPLPLRLLVPTGEPKGLVLDFHGGGWVVGGAALNDRLTGHYAEAGYAVASVDYRLLDEVRGVWMPDAVADCAAALRWALTEGVRRFVGPVFAVGESAGAHLAALAAILLRDSRGLDGLAGLVFVQGVFDLSAGPDVRAAGPETLLFDGPNLERDLGRLTPDLDETARRAPDLSPLYAELSGLPPALFVVGEKDPFRDDSLRMAARWADTSEAVLLDVPTAPHGFQHFGAPTAALAQTFMRGWMGEFRANTPLSVENTTT